MDSPVGGIPRGAINDFCTFLAVQNKSRIPEGYVFRLPTECCVAYVVYDIISYDMGSCGNERN